MRQQEKKWRAIQEWAYKVCPPFSFSCHLLTTTNRTDVHTDAMRRGSPFSSRFYLTQTRRGGVSPFSACIFSHRHRHNTSGRTFTQTRRGGISPSCRVSISHRRDEEGYPPSQHVSFHTDTTTRAGGCLHRRDEEGYSPSWRVSFHTDTTTRAGVRLHRRDEKGYTPDVGTGVPSLFFSLSFY